MAQAGVLAAIESNYVDEYVTQTIALRYWQFSLGKADVVEFFPLSLNQHLNLCLQNMSGDGVAK